MRLSAFTVFVLSLCGTFALFAADVRVETIDADGRKTVAISPLKISDGHARFVLPRAQIVPGTRSVAVKPDFAAARVGDEGYWVHPDGTIGGYHETDGMKVIRKNWFPMPIFGMKTGATAFVAVVTGAPYHFSIVTQAKKGVYSTWADFDVDPAEAGEDLVIDYWFLSGDEADYSGMARRYRRYQLERGACRPIAERMKRQPLLAYAARYPEVRIRQAWKPVPSPVPDQTVKDEPPIHAAVTFDRVKDIIDECRRQNVGGAEFCLVGWNVGGHDGRWPQAFPVEPALGGEAKLKEAISYTQKNGYQIVGHGNHRDAYMIADTWDIEYVMERNPDGTLKKGNTSWGGGRLYTICPRRAYERFAVKDAAAVATLGFKGLYYLDVTTSRPLFPCRDVRHPLTNRERAAWEGSILQLQRDTFGGSASEGAFDFCIGSVDSALTVAWSKPFEPKKNKMIDRDIPLWQLVYHGIVLSTPFRTTINCTAHSDKRYTLKLAEFGGRPTFYFYSRFVTGRPASMGDIDLTCATDAELRRSVGYIKAGYDEYARRSGLQTAFMDRHEKLGPGVFRTTYSDGVRMIVNYTEEPVTVGGVTVPARDFALTAARAQ